MRPTLIPLLLATLALPATAQTITFDTDDYRSISVYDTWEQSPFRLQPEAGHAAVIDNHLTHPDPILGHAPNTSPRILGFQRSRHASNTYGVRINLKEPFRLTKHNRYLHVMVHLADKPSPSRMMVIGLGKRVEPAWNWQTGEDEQFWALSATPVAARDGWQDEVFAIRGFSYAQEDSPLSGIDIHALVLVPDVASRQQLAEDFVCYFDQIEINDSNARRFHTETYAPSFGHGNAGTDNPTAAHGGIAGLVPNAHGETVRVSDQQLNGSVVAAADNQVLNHHKAPYGQPFAIRMVPAPGFVANGLRVRYGRNLHLPQFDQAGNPHWLEETYTADQLDAQGCLTLPAQVMVGRSVSIEGFFVEAPFLQPSTRQ